MRGVLTHFILLFSVGFAFSQKSKIDTIYHPNAMVYQIDSIYECGTIRLQKNFYAGIESLTNSDLHLKNSEWVHLESKGELVLIEDEYWIQRGLWKYWDEDGNIKLETFIDHQKGETKYINQWLPDGTQILNNGNGHFYQIDMRRNSGYGLDSVVFEIKDSLKNGSYTVWCRLENGGFYRCETGQYINNRKQSLEISFFDNGRVQTIEQYMNGVLEGECHRFFKNGIYSQYGQYHEGLKVGNWKYWNREGVLVKECNYKEGRLFGPFTEYYSNAKIKHTGNYVHITGTDTFAIFDPFTLEEIIETEEIDDIPVKDGRWYFYDQKGDFLRMEEFFKGKLLKE